MVLSTNRHFAKTAQLIVRLGCLQCGCFGRFLDSSPASTPVFLFCLAIPCGQEHDQTPHPTSHIEVILRNPTVMSVYSICSDKLCFQLPGSKQGRVGAGGLKEVRVYYAE